jgi:hypothetical protein
MCVRPRAPGAFLLEPNSIEPGILRLAGWEGVGWKIPFDSRLATVVAGLCGEGSFLPNRAHFT